MMSVLRKIGKGFAGFFFTLSLITAVTTFSLIEFTQPDTLKNVASELFQAQAGSQEIPISGENQELLEDVKAQCQSDSSLEFDVGDAKITCDDLEVLGSGSATDFVVSKVINDAYLTEYKCGLINCLITGEEPFPLLITKHANDFYKELLNYAIIATIVFGVLFVITAQTIKEKLRGLGFSLLWVSLPFIVGSFFIGDVVNLVAPAQISEMVSPIIDNLISSILGPTIMIYIYILVAGAALTLASYIVRPDMFSSGKKK